MTTTVTYQYSDITATDVSIAQFDKTKLSLQSYELRDAGRTNVAKYVDIASDPSQPTIITVTQSADPKSGIVRTSIRLSATRVTEVDGEVMEEAQSDFGVYWNLPSASEDPSAEMSLLLAAISLTWDTLTAKVPQTGIVSKLNLGITNGLFG